MWVRFIVGRVAWAIFLALFVVALVFVIFQVLPSGDQASLRAGRFASPDQVEAIRSAMGLDRSVFVRFGIFVRDLFIHFDLGTSSRTGTDVKEVIVDRIPVTLTLVVGASLVWFAGGILAGVLGGARAGSVGDRLAGATSLFLVSAPIFWVGYMAIFLLGSAVGLLPLLPGVGGWQEAEHWSGHLAALLLPSIVLGVSSAAVYYRLTRVAIRSELRSPYSFAASARGLGGRTVLWRHAARTGLTPIIGLAGLDLGLLLAGNVILVETVFNLPGLGSLLTASIDRSDLPVVEALVLVAALFMVVVNLAADITFRLSDPRPRDN